MIRENLLIQLRFAVLLVTVVALSAFTPLHAADPPLPQFEIATEKWVPYQYVENGELKGIAVDILVLMLHDIGSEQGRSDIKINPWAKAYNYALNKENTILFSTTRTPERENKFKWVGPINRNATRLIAEKKKAEKIKINSRADIKHYRYVTVIDDIGESYLQREGVLLKNMLRNPDRSATVKILRLGRADMAVQSWDGFVRNLLAAKIDPDNFTPIFTINQAEICYAFFKETPDWIIAKFQSSFDRLQATGKVDEIKRNYGKMSSY